MLSVGILWECLKAKMAVRIARKNLTRRKSLTHSVMALRG